MFKFISSFNPIRDKFIKSAGFETKSLYLRKTSQNAKSRLFILKDAQLKETEWDASARIDLRMEALMPNKYIYDSA